MFCTNGLPHVGLVEYYWKMTMQQWCSGMLPAERETPNPGRQVVQYYLCCSWFGGMG